MIQTNLNLQLLRAIPQVYGQVFLKNFKDCSPLKSEENSTLFAEPSYPKLKIIIEQTGIYTT